jgi:hypothetical protein
MYKLFSYIQILILICLIAWSGGTSVKLPRQSGKFLCEKHQCGCKSEFDCMTNCCCAFTENPNVFQKKNKSLQAFISSINCNYGNDPLTGIAATTKYIKEYQIQPTEESFLCFIFLNTPVNPSKIIASRPERPPRYFL